MGLQSTAYSLGRSGLGRGDRGREQVADGVRQLLVGAVQEQGEVPKVRIGEGAVVGRHAGVADAKTRGPKELAYGFGGGRLAVAAEEFLCVRQHLAAKGGLIAGCAMAPSALGAIDAGAGFEAVFTGGEGRLFCTGGNAAMQGNGLGQVLPKGGPVGGGNRWVAEIEVGDDAENGEERAGEHADQKAADAGAAVVIAPVGRGTLAIGGAATGERAGLLGHGSPSGGLVSVEIGSGGVSQAACVAVCVREIA